jgi:uncharacterized protein
MFRSLIIASALAFSVAHAADVPASEASIREMLSVTEARKLIDGMFPQIEAMMKNSMQQALNGQTLSAEQQKIADKMNTKMMALMRDEMSWDKLEPLYLSVYQKSFTQAELDGMLAFYKTPAGTAMIKKMPVVLAQTMSAMQQKMGPMMQKIQQAVQETIAEIEAAEPKTPAAAPQTP